MKTKTGNLIVCGLLCLTQMTCTQSEKVNYADLYDPVADVGQYKLPALSRTPGICREVAVEGNRLKDYLLAASITGLTARALEQGKTNVGVWMACNADRAVAYRKERASLEARGCRFLPQVDPLQLATDTFEAVDGMNVTLKHLFDGYILTDLEQNPESGSVAVTASHVYNGLIVDRPDRERFEKAGYKLLYDASEKNVREAWNEFGDRCEKTGLVIMPNDTWELRDVAIQNGWFFLNLYPRPHDATNGEYWDLYETVCRTLDSHHLIYGWEAGRHNEREINETASRHAQASAVNDWFYNACLTSADYRRRQEPVLARVLDPKTIDYHKNKRLVSFFMTDGDNNQWMMGGFIEHWYDLPESAASKVAFGIAATTLPQMAPAAFKYILERQPQNSTLLEVQGGGVYYSDTYAAERNRPEDLREKARLTSAYMRQHRIRMVGLMANREAGSPEAMEAYRIFAEANDQLAGILAYQYTPYAAGAGDIYWVTNKKGYDIPVVTIKYSLWNEPYLREREGTPRYIARCLDKDRNHPEFNLIGIHAWSRFSDQGKDCDDLAETKDGVIGGPAIARLLENHLDDSYETVSLEELVWQIRMKHRPKQTKKYLDSLL
ncbi:MAG: hypothetical protein LBP50_08625 [Tannerella sp.]|jgi:hypothetical protein|nr:hypothetical protein [Tannerella sp.]